MLLRLRALVLVLAGLLYVASWPGAPLHAVVKAELTAPPIPDDLEGRSGVVDVIVRAKDGDKAPIAGARVRAYAMIDERAHAAGDVTTDADGRATLRDLPEAEHWIVAEALGRARASQRVVVVAGARRLDIELGVEHELEVAVEDEREGAIADAELEVRGTDPFPIGARTDARGRARVGRLSEGPYTVVARARGYEEATRRKVPEGSPVVIVLGRQGTLSVEVALEDGASASGARVLVSSSGLGSPRVAEADHDGKVQISGLDRGSYALRATKGTLVSPIEIGVVVGKGEQKTVRLVLAPGRMITAHVTDAASDDDVEDARVSLAEDGVSPFPIEGVTDARGRVVLGPIERGSATLSVHADGFVPKPAVPVGDRTSDEVTVALSRGGALVGKITDARGDAIDGATIRVVGTDLDGMPIDEDPVRSTFRRAHFAAQLEGPSPLVPAGELGVMPGPVPPIPHGPSFGVAFAPGGALGAPTVRAEPWVSGRDGSFRAVPVTPGRVRALVRHPQYVEAFSEVVLVASDAEARVDVVLRRGGTLEGRVVDARGRGVDDVQVTALATRGSLEHVTRTDVDGSFAFAALPEAVTVLASRGDGALAADARVEVAVPEGGKKTISITLPDPRPALPVRVTDRRGEGLEAVQVSAVSIDATEALRVTAFSDARGRAELAGARGIAVRIEVRAAGHAARVVVTTPESPEVVVALAPAERITGEVVAGRREPVVGADVTLRTDAWVRHARTDGDGVFSIGDLAPGPARLRVRAEGWAPEERTVTIEDLGGRRPTELARIELVEEGVVEGLVVDDKGEPVAGARVAKDAVPTYLPVGAAPSGMSITDAQGRFRLGQLPEGALTLEAYAADVGRARSAAIAVSRGRTTRDVRLVLARGEAGPKEPVATGGVAVTLGDTAGGSEPAEVVVVDVSEGSEAERAGLAAGDVLLEVGGAEVSTIAAARARLSGPVHDDVLVKLRRGEHVFALRITREAVRR